jgi:CheY-like chemotaxis protein
VHIFKEGGYVIPKRILVVDNEPDELESYTGILEGQGFEVHRTTSGTQAIALYKREDFDLSLLDLKIPDMDGLKVLAALREYDSSAAVIIFTAHGTKETVVEALRLGACEFIEKPADAETLTGTVHRVLAQGNGAAVRGNLRSMSLPSIVQINCTERNQARLRIKRQGQEGSVFFADGEVVHAVLDSRVGEEVVYELLTWADGDFQLDVGVSPPEQTMTTSWSGLLLEGMRRIDERAADLGEVEELEESEESKEVKAMAKLNDLLKEMAGEIPGFVSADVVGMDGLSVAHYAVDSDFDAESACAQFALLMKLVQKSVDQLGAGTVEDNLVTGKKTYVLSRFLGDKSYYMEVAVDKETSSLGNVRLMMRQYADDLWDAIPRRKR